MTTEDAEDRGEIIKCPFCGAWAYEDDIEPPSAYCHHPEAPAPTEDE